MTAGPVRTARLSPAVILRAGAAVGVLDGLFAVMMYAVILRVTTATRIFQGIARALLGTSAFDGGLATAALGLAMHFGMALAWSAVYYLLYRRAGWLRELAADRWGPVVIGAVYGPIVWALMNRVIVPLTRAPPMSMHSWQWPVMSLGHMVFVGLPIAVIVREGRVG